MADQIKPLSPRARISMPAFYTLPSLSLYVVVVVVVVVYRQRCAMYRDDERRGVASLYYLVIVLLSAITILKYLEDYVRNIVFILYV